jgi:hypothetical protein
LRGAQPLPPGFAIEGALSVRAAGTFSTAVVRDWTPLKQRELERQTGGEVEVESMGLEEIFLELHR